MNLPRLLIHQNETYFFLFDKKCIQENHVPYNFLVILMIQKLRLATLHKTSEWIYF